MGILDKAIEVDSMSEHFKGLIYGRAGSRKTTWASTAPNPLWIDFERSSDTLRHIGKGNTKVIRPKSMDDVLEVARELKRSDYKTVVIDTATRMQLFQISEFMKQVVKKNESVDVYLPRWADYRRTGNQLDELFMRLHDLEMHVIVLAHEKQFFDEDSKRLVQILPDLTPRLRDAVSGLLNVVAYVELKQRIGGPKEERGTDQIMHFVSANKFFAKNRLNLQTPITNPDFSQVFTEGN